MSHAPQAAQAGAGAPRAVERLRADRWGLSIVASHAGASRVNPNLVDAGIVGLLVLAVLLQGVVEGLGLPGKVELATDVASLALLALTVVAIIRSGATVRIPYIVLALAAVVVIAAIRSDELLRMLVSARNFLVLPTLALAIATLGLRERRSRLLVVTAIGLAFFEFGLSIIQAAVRADVDLVVGSFGDYAGPSLAFALMAGTCLALGIYASGTGGWTWLLVALVLPVFSVWAAIRAVPVMLPVVGGAVVVTAWWANRGAPAQPTPRRRPKALAIALVVLASTATVFGAYAIARPTDFDLFTDSDKRGHYLDTGDLATPKPGGSGTSTSASEVVLVPGRGEQYRTAAQLINDDPLSFLFGNGLGATTYAANLGLDEPPERERIAGYSDVGSAVVEVGWLGVALLLVGALGLVGACMSAARRLAPGSWSRALVIAYPGILAALAACAVLGTPLRNAGSATLFWLLTAGALAVVLWPSEGSDVPD